MASRDWGHETTCERYTQTWRELRDKETSKLCQDEEIAHPYEQNAARRQNWFITGLSAVLVTMVALAGYGLWKLIF